MSNILEALADDNLCIHPPIYRGSPAYREAVRTMCETAEALEAKLDDGEKELFEKFCNAQDDEGHLYQVETFIRGFRIAALMLFEVFAAGDADFISGKETE